MPREKKPRRELFQTWVDDDPELYSNISIRDNDLFCNICAQIISSSRKSNVTRHLKSHISSSSIDSVFLYELTAAFLASGIPFYKLSNPVLRQFLEKYINRKLPHPSTLRHGYVDQVYRDVVQNIREAIADNFVYFIVDESTDACKRCVTNFVIGALKTDNASDSYLLASKVLDDTNPKSIVNFVKDCFHFVWPNRDNSNRVLVMLTDSGAHMLEAGALLSVTFSNMIHFTCMGHALNRISEKIKNSFPLVNELIVNVKEIFSKAPTRRDSFRKELPGTPLPPEPTATRWGSWLEAVTYYNEHFDGVKGVLYNFNPSDYTAIYTVQSLLEVQTVRDVIHYIIANYSFLIDAIRKLEMCGLSLQEQFMVLNTVRKRVNDNAHIFGNVMKEEIEDVFKKNPGYSTLEQICKFLSGAYQELPPPLLRYSSYIYNFSYCPLVMADVERTFCLRKLLLSERRRSLTPKNLEKYIVINFYLQRNTI